MAHILWETHASNPSIRGAYSMVGSQIKPTCMVHVQQEKDAYNPSMHGTHTVVGSCLLPTTCESTV